MRYRLVAYVCALFLLLCVLGGGGHSFALMNAELEVAWQVFRLEPPAPSADTTGSPLPDTAPDARNDPQKGNLLALPRELALAITLTPPADTYIYGPAEDDMGLPTQVNVSVSFGHGPRLDLPVLAPPPVQSTATGEPGQSPLVYSGPVTFLVFIPGGEGALDLHIDISALICSKKNCLPFDRQISIPLSAEALAGLPLATESALRANKDYLVTSLQPQSLLPGLAGANGSGLDSFSPEDTFDFSFLQPTYFNPGLEVTALGSALLLGLVAGLILNLMPCVLPVISLKFSALMAVTAMTDRQKQARAFRKHCLIFAAGIMTWFVVLALLVGLAGLAWGELFQNPVVVSILGFILFLLGLSLFGVFNLPIFDLKVSSPANPNWQAFASGLLATLLATPCSGPLLGGVLGWGVRQSLPVLLLTVASVGVGMSFPYFVMACSPRLVHLLPKPGPWTLRLEQLMGFFLMGSVAYLIFLLPPDWVQAYLIALVAVAFAAWLWGQVGHLGASNEVRIMARLGAALTLLIALWMVRVSTDNDNNWEYFEPGTFSALLGKEQLLVEFTADWCPSCKAMEQTTLHEDRLDVWRNRFGLRTIRVDLTRDDKAGKALLQALGSSSIPVIALFPKGKAAHQPLVLRDIVTARQLESAMEKVF